MAIDCRPRSSRDLVPLLRWSVHPMHLQRLRLLRDRLQSQSLIGPETTTYAPGICIYLATHAGRSRRCCSRDGPRNDRAIRAQRVACSGIARRLRIERIDLKLQLGDDADCVSSAHAFGGGLEPWPCCWWCSHGRLPCRGIRCRSSADGADVELPCARRGVCRPIRA
jgi:hypothetical protein